jgi:prephenate dehydrogenase
VSNVTSERIALIGCGHIGGSIALAARQAGISKHVVGFDASRAAMNRARERGICDQTADSPELAVKDSTWVVLAVPVRAIAECAARIANAVEPAAIVTDVGSTKGGVVRACEAHLHPRARFVGTHPLAGTERAGPDAADGKMFVGKKVFLTPTPATDSAAVVTVKTLWRDMGAEPFVMDPDQHDRVMAAVSHLPHAVAYSLVACIAGQEGADGGYAFAGLAGGGFADTTRIASTPSRIWVDIFLENRAAMLDVMGAFGRQLAALQEAIAARDAHAIEEILETARLARTRIMGG